MGAPSSSRSSRAFRLKSSTRCTSGRRSRRERESLWVSDRGLVQRFLDSPELSRDTPPPDPPDAPRRAYRVDVEEFAGWLRKRSQSLGDVDAATLSAYTAQLGAARPRRDPSKLGDRKSRGGG